MPNKKSLGSHFIPFRLWLIITFQGPKFLFFFCAFGVWLPHHFWVMLVSMPLRTPLTLNWWPLLPDTHLPPTHCHVHTNVLCIWATLYCPESLAVKQNQEIICQHWLVSLSYPNLTGYNLQCHTPHIHLPPICDRRIHFVSLGLNRVHPVGVTGY